LGYVDFVLTVCSKIYIYLKFNIRKQPALGDKRRLFDLKEIKKNLEKVLHFIWQCNIIKKIYPTKLVGNTAKKESSI
jgi:hypothetical protein